MKRGQEYTIGTVVYLLTFFCVLIIGTYGIHTKFAIQSRTEEYQLTALTMEEMAKTVMNIVNSERRYALDKSLYFIGAYGGYFPSLDFQIVPDCYDGKPISTTTCIDSEGNFYVPEFFVVRNERIRDCGLALTMYENPNFLTPFTLLLPEREYGLPIYLDYYRCPSIANLDKDELIKNIERASRFFSEIDPQVYTYLDNKYGKFLEIDKYYILKINDMTQAGIDYTWYPMNNPKIVLYDGINYYNSSVVYSTDLVISGYIENSFYHLFQTAEDRILTRETREDIKSMIDNLLDKRTFNFDYVHCEDCRRNTEFFFATLKNDVWYSVDGNNWEKVAIPSTWAAREGHAVAVYDNKDAYDEHEKRERMWMTGGQFYIISNDVLYAETEGSFSRLALTSTSPQRLGITEHTFLNFNDTLWILGGHRLRIVNNVITYDYTNEIWKSKDGSRWQKVNAVGPDGTANSLWFGRSGHTSIVFPSPDTGNMAMWVMGGYSKSTLRDTHLNDVWYSEDGRVWKQATDNAGWPIRRGHTSVVFANSMWVMGGQNKSSYHNDVWYSLTGESWAKISSSAGWEPRSEHTTVVFDDGTGDKMFVMGGKGPDEYYNDVWASFDGTTWNKHTPFFGDMWSTRKGHTSVVYNNSIWIIGGDEGGSSLDTDISCSYCAEDFYTLTKGTYTEVEDVGYTLYKSYLGCFSEESLRDCIIRKITKDVLEFVPEGSDELITTKILLTDFNISDFIVEIESQNTTYYKLLEYRRLKPLITGVNDVIITRGGGDPCVDGFTEGSAEFSSLYWPDVITNPAKAIDMAKGRLIQSGVVYNNLKERRDAHIRRIFGLTIVNPFLDPDVEAALPPQNFKKVKMEIVNATGDVLFEYVDEDEFLVGQYNSYEVVLDYIVEPVRKTCYNPNFQ